jgi:hypothetical protein
MNVLKQSSLWFFDLSIYTEKTSVKSTTQKTLTIATLFHQTRLALLGSIASVVSVTMLSVPVPPASAAQGCTPAPFGYVCVTANGKGTRITSVGVQRGKGDKSLICNYRGRVVVTSPSGKTLWSRTSSRNQCTPLRAWFGWKVNRSFPAGSQICSSFYENGTKQGGSPCLTVKP